MQDYILFRYESDKDYTYSIQVCRITLIHAWKNTSLYIAESLYFRHKSDSYYSEIICELYMYAQLQGGKFMTTPIQKRFFGHD